jgi:hypothetical protein
LCGADGSFKESTWPRSFIFFVSVCLLTFDEMNIMRSCVVALLLAVAQLTTALYTNGSVVAPCDSQIYCYGELLREVELARPFADSKTFVDL